MADDERQIGGGPRLPRGRNKNTPMTNVTAQVKTDGLNVMERLLSSMAKSTTTIAKNLKLINAEGRTGSGAFGGFLAGITGRAPSGGGGTLPWQGSLPPSMQKVGGYGSITPRTNQPINMPGGIPTWQQNLPPSMQRMQPPDDGGGGGGGGRFRNSMPWMRNAAGTVGLGVLAAAPVAASMLSGRIGQQITEGAPIAGSNLLTASMYRGTQYHQIERDRFRQLGQFAGSRQDVAAAGQMALRLGQTPDQAGRYLQGIGNTVQAMGGTMTAPQVIQASGGFQDSLVMRRQIAAGMRPARIGGQVRNPMEVSQDYIRNFESKFNQGRKLNEYDFINLQTPGSGLRIRFQRLYGLDDAAIDMLVVAGMQTLKSNGTLNYNSSQALSAAGMSGERLSLATTSLQTTKGVRNANFMANTEGGMVNMLQTEETVQRAFQDLEEATSGLISEFASMERVIKTVTTGLGVLAGLSILKGGLGGGGGITGLGGGAGFGGFARGAGGAVGTGAPAAAAAGTAAPAAAAATGGRMAGLASKAGAAVVGAGFGISAAKDAVNASNWGDLFSAGAKGAAAGAAFGSMVGMPWAGAAAGGVLAFGAAGISWLNENDRGERTSEQSQNAANMTDKEILDQLSANQGSTARAATQGMTPQQIEDYNRRMTDVGTPWLRTDASTRTGGAGPILDRPWDQIHGDTEDPVTEGIVDRFQVRRSKLIADWMAATRESGTSFDSYIKFLAQRLTGKRNPTTTAINSAYRRWSDVETKFSTFSQQEKVGDDAYISAGKSLLHITEGIRSRNASSIPGGQALNDLYHEFFRNDVDHPMQYKPVYSDAAIDIIGQYQYDPSDLAAPVVIGDPVFGDATTGTPYPVGNTHGGLTPTVPFDYGTIANLKMGPEPDDPDWNKMDKRMQQRLRIMFANSGGQIKWSKGGGWRSEVTQRNLFLSRYRPDPNGEITWNGQKWKHVSGPAAAPPGRSYHEIGLAADLGGPGVGNGWLKKNARKFGLKEFSSVNDEPWHVQLIELPNGRSGYDAASDTGGPGEATVTGTQPAETGPVSGAVGGSSGIGGGSSAGLLTYSTSSLAALAGGGGSSVSSGSGASYEGTGGATTADTVTDYSGTGPLTGEQIAKMAYAIGFRGQGLINAIGITNRESNWDPSAHAGGDEDSYGLWQINMNDNDPNSPNMGKKRAQQFGITRYDQLFDPTTNMKAAYSLSQSGTEFGPWLTYRPGLALSQERISTATSIINSLHLGDAVFDSGQGVSQSAGQTRAPVSLFGSMVASGSAGGGGGVNVNVTIQSNGNYGYDAQRLAKAVRPAFEAEYAEVSAKRSS